MRYFTQSHYFFIYINFTGAPRFERGYVPWEDKLNKIHLISAVCTERHRVPGEWDDRPQYDGFVFAETEAAALGRTWYNQYPRALFTMMDDFADYRIHPAVLSSVPKNGEERSQTFNSMMSEFGTDFPEFEDVRTFLKRLELAMRESKPDHYGWNRPLATDPEKRVMLQELYDRIVEMIKERGFRIENESHTFDRSSRKIRRVSLPTPIRAFL